MDKQLKITNKEQKERLVFLMEENPQIARGVAKFGCSRQQTTEMWAHFAIELNGLGPPIRTGAEWQRVWIHFKASLKKKLAKNKAELRQTGGGPLQELSFSPTEERIMYLTNINQSINPSGETLGVIEIDDEETAATPPHSAKSAASVGTPVFAPPATSVPTKRAKIEDSRIKMLAEQVDIQKQMLAVYKKIEKTTYKMYELKKQDMKMVAAAMEEEKELRKLKMAIAKKKLLNLSDNENSYEDM